MDIQKISSEITTLLSTNDDLINELKKISSEIYVNTIKSGGQIDKSQADLEHVNNVKTKARLINRKIQDNIATVNSLASQIQLDPNYFNDSQSIIFYRSKPVSNSFSDVYNGNSSSDVHIVFQNVGFKSWTKANGIFLRVHIANSLKGIGSYDNVFDFQLGDNDVIKMGDVKDFKIAVAMPSTATTYTVDMLLQNSSGPINGSQSKIIHII